MTTPARAAGTGPPHFNASAARRLREALGLDFEHVAYGMEAAYGLRTPPAAVAAWEAGRARPTYPELIALAGALWCTPSELIGRPSPLRDHRLARGLDLPDVARRIGMDPATYHAAEESGHWPGTDRQALALAHLLRLPLPALLDLTGRTGHLTELLRDAATTRWQAYVRPVTTLTGLARRPVERALRELHGQYHARMAATLNWGQDRLQSDAGAAGASFLEEIVPRFWELLTD